MKESLGIVGRHIVIVPGREQMNFVGIDVGKRHHQAVVVDEQGELCGDTVDHSNTRPGIESLVDRLEGLDEPVRIAPESSGQYWLCLYDQLTSHGYDVVVINPLQINAWDRGRPVRVLCRRQCCAHPSELHRCSLAGIQPSQSTMYCAC